MGGNSSKNKKKSQDAKSKTPPARPRGSSRTPPEAWERGSVPDFRTNWQNTTNTSYNLLDLQPYRYTTPGTPLMKRWRSPSPPVKKKRSPSPIKSYRGSPSPTRRLKRSPSPPLRRKRSPSPYKPSEDKFKHFKNITEKRDALTPARKPRSPEKHNGSPEKYNRSPVKYNRSPEKIINKSPAKSPVKSPTKTIKSPEKSLRSPMKQAKSPVKSSSSRGAPYVSAKKKDKKKSSGRRNSFPNQHSVDFKKPKEALKPRVDERRLSDVSTIEVDEKPAFRPIAKKSTTTTSKLSSHKRTFSVDSLPTSNSSPYVKNRAPSRGLKGSKNRISPPQTSSQKKIGDKIRRNFSHGSLGSELSFTNIGVVKSATNSMQSTRSNFEVNERIEKFNDKKTSLVQLDCAKHTVLNNSFRDAKLPGGPQAGYEEAKKQLQKEEWEVKLNGIEKIVTISRTASEVLRNDMKTCVKLMHDELKNLRSQVCRAAATAWSEMFISLGKSLEPFLDSVVITLLQKSADTNKFIREGSVEALLAMSENVSVSKAISTVIDGGINSKSATVRTQTAFLIDHIINALGPERFYGASKETQVFVVSNGAKMLGDGSLEVRTHAKHMLKLLANHAQFEPLIKEVIPENELRTIKKSLDSLKQ